MLIQNGTTKNAFTLCKTLNCINPDRPLLAVSNQPQHNPQDGSYGLFEAAIRLCAVRQTAAATAASSIVPHRVKTVVVR